jgi:PREDICTED: similar to futsch CG3064-PB
MSFFSKIKSTFFEEVDENEEIKTKNIEEKTSVETLKPREDEKTENIDNNKSLRRAEFNMYEDETPEDFVVAKTQSFKVVPIKEEKEQVTERPKIEEKVEIKIQREISQPRKIEKEEPVKRIDETRPFRPSSIVSPVFGIIDKNPLKKYEATKVKNDKDKILDGIRTYVTPMGIKTVSVKEEKELKPKEEKIVDLKEESSVPNVKNVTIEDASEYYNDLGLEYNVNYKDNRVSTVDEFSEDEEVEIKREEEKEKTNKILKEESDKNKKNKDSTDEEDLFNLIESMYEKDN